MRNDKRGTKQSLQRARTGAGAVLLMVSPLYKEDPQCQREWILLVIDCFREKAEKCGNTSM